MSHHTLTNATHAAGDDDEAELLFLPITPIAEEQGDGTSAAGGAGVEEGGVVEADERGGKGRKRKGAGLEASKPPKRA